MILASFDKKVGENKIQGVGKQCSYKKERKMPGINNNLYPPIFKKSYVPAFVGSCRIYFSISMYNREEDIKKNCVQIIVQNQKTNQSVLNKTNYPSGVKLGILQVDNEIKNENKYYIEIGNEDIENGFQYNQYYKVQIRFTSVSAANPTDTSKLDSWLNANFSNFSQWSTVVLIKPISKPIISLKNFEKDSIVTIPTNDLTVFGTVSNGITADREIFKNYKILIYDSQDNLLQESQNLFFESSNNIQYNCKYNFETDHYYKLCVQVLTKNLYLEQAFFDFYVSYSFYGNFQGEITATIDNNIGCAIVNIKNNIFSQLGTNIVIRRASSKDNFIYWEDVFTTLIKANTTLNLIWKDYTIESGVWYKYSVVKRNKNNIRSTSIEIRDPIMGVFQDIFLTTKDQQLRVRLDPQVNNFSKVVSESLTETLGSKYPFIRRNSAVGYRTFSLSGTISYFLDIGYNLMHASQEETYGEYVYLYRNYNQENNINQFKDIVQEKNFREKVLDFLYSNDVKLYKSATEGNLLVKLMNITLTPNNNLGRQIYTFNCTVYEIDDFNYQNCIKYHIQEEGEYIEQTSLSIVKYGQIYIPQRQIYYFKDGVKIYNKEENLYFGNKNLLETMITNKYKTLAKTTTSIEVQNLSYLRIELTSDPYLIGVNSGGTPYQLDKNAKTTNAYLGHIVIINDKYIIIGKEGIYELSGDDISITNLSFVSPYEQGVIDYEVSLVESMKTSEKDFTKITSIFRTGQLWGTFNLSNNLIYTQIANKYKFTKFNLSFSQELQRISGLCVQAEPGMTFYVKQNQDSDYEKHVLNETGLLEFYSDNTDIKGLYFIGPKLEEVTAEEVRSRGIGPYEFYDTNEVLTLTDMQHPKNNCVYRISPAGRIDSDSLVIGEEELENLPETSFLLWNVMNTVGEDLNFSTLGLFYTSFDKYIYYQGAWYPFTDDHEVLISSVDAIIDYYCEILRKEY